MLEVQTDLIQGWVFDIQRYSINDGPGIRTTVFLKGCPLGCLWCDNPESQVKMPELLYLPSLCITCQRCAAVCPTGAIQKIDEQAKMGVGQKPIRIGTAMFDRGRCLPWAMATPCMVCEEFCPTSPKAIWVEKVQVAKRADTHGPSGSPPAISTVTVQQPHVDPSLCVGCGVCEKVCPIADKPAVYVTSAGETRSRTNTILLQNGG